MFARLCLADLEKFLTSKEELKLFGWSCRHSRDDEGKQFCESFDMFARDLVSQISIFRL